MKLSKKIDPEYRNAFETALAEKNVKSLRYLSVLAAVFVPLYLILDNFQAPDFLREFFYIRMYISLFSIVTLFISFTKIGKLKHELVASCLVLTIGIGIAFMVHCLGGYKSPYYAGINLVVLATGVLFTWKPVTSIATFSTILLSYFLPIFFQKIEDWKILVNNSFFFVTTIVVVVVALYFGYYSFYEQVVLSENLKKSRAEIQNAYSALAEKDRYKTQFFSNITHELRTPLTLILTPIESILNDRSVNLSAQQKVQFQYIYKNALGLLKLINDLLDIAKMDEARMKLRIQRVDLKEKIEQIVSNLTPLVARKGLKLNFICESNPDNMIIDWNKIERAIINLLSNAVKFTDPGGQIKITVGEENGFGIISVEDTGIGIKPEFLPHIFDRFYQVDGSITRRYGGTGIGLAFSKEIVELHGGKITVESTYGKGSTFTIKLLEGKDHYRQEILESQEPIYEKVDHESKVSPNQEIGEYLTSITSSEKYRFIEISELTERRLVERSSERLGNKPMVLIVDDNQNILRFLTFLLGDEFDVIVAQNGKKGLELVNRFHPDLIITDYMMPEMDGMELCKYIKSTQEYASTPVIMLTAKGDVTDRIKGKELGADEYIQKPFNSTELLTSVRKLIKEKMKIEKAFIEERISSTKIFAAGIMHEINNSLNYIRNSCLVVEKEWKKIKENYARQTGVDESDKKIMKMLDICDKGITRIKKIVDSVKDFSKEGFAQIPRACDVEEAIHTVTNILFPVPEKNVKLEMNLCNQPAKVICLPEYLNQVLSNLIRNAIDAVSDGGKIIVKTEIEENNVIISIIDNGQGMDTETKNRIFTPFFSTKPPGAGMGLGLYVSFKMVKEMGGTIDVKSEPGKGSEFRIVLPVGQDAHESQPATNGA